jgi:hypothetical protein
MPGVARGRRSRSTFSASSTDRACTRRINSPAPGIRRLHRRSDVVRQLSKPEDAQEFESASFLDKEPVGSSCIYYNEKDVGLLEGTTYQLCFTSDWLDSEAAY